MYVCTAVILRILLLTLPMDLQHSVFKSPLGLIKISGTREFITEVKFCDEDEPEIDGEHSLLHTCKSQLQEYFEGQRKTFDLPIKPHGTEFKLKVWQLLTEINYGHTITYGSIAGKLNMDKGASRAIGLANGKNPIAIIIPCHRVIGQNGNLTGYAGGLWRKQKLLELERNNSVQDGVLF
jgi:methylated-DNA-[protein]-cysteine S-methyltransferase